MSVEQKIKKNVALNNFTTFHIGGVAKYFFQAENKEEIIEAIQWAQQKKLPFFVLGGGSNILISDKGYKGLIIRLQSTSYKLQTNIIEAEAGVPLGKVVGLALQQGLTGLEWAMGIPGTVGGAVFGNAGAFGKSMADVVETVEVIDISNFQFSPVVKGFTLTTGQAIFNFQKKECEFGYRESIFKRNKNLIILSARIKLEKGNKEAIEKQMKEFFQVKRNAQPLEYFSAGCVFKNPENISAGELIEKANLKGKQIGQAQISNKHSNFIVNMGKAKAIDVVKLINLTKKTVKRKFNVDLEEEIQYFGF